MPRPTLSLVLPSYNEEAVIPELEARLKEFFSALHLDCEVIFVDDGSRDRSIVLLRELAEKNPNYLVLSFSRNFGHQYASTAGIDYASGVAIVVSAGDIQHPPE